MSRYGKGRALAGICGLAIPTTHILLSAPGSWKKADAIGPFSFLVTENLNRTPPGVWKQLRVTELPHGSRPRTLPRCRGVVPAVPPSPSPAPGKNLLFFLRRESNRDCRKHCLRAERTGFPSLHSPRGREAEHSTRPVLPKSRPLSPVAGEKPDGCCWGGTFF